MTTSDPKPDPLTVRLLTRGGFVANAIIAFMAYDTGHLTDAAVWIVAALICAYLIIHTERNWYKDVRTVR